MKQTIEQQSIAGKSLLSLQDLTKEEILYVLDLAAELKKQNKKGELIQPLAGKTLGMIFEKSSTRTRVSFETGIYQLGGMGLYLNSKDLQLGRGEPVADTAKVLSGYLDAIMIRANSHKMVEELAAHATIPVINGLTDLFHPCQALADLQTILEYKGTLDGVKLAYIGDANNVANSLMIAAAKTGMQIRIASPAGYQPLPEIVEIAREISDDPDFLLITESPEEAASGADVLYTDVWTSMGQEEETQARLTAFQGFQVNETLMDSAASDAIFLHCLPAHRGEEVAAAVIDGPQSAVFQEAENRLHAQKALMLAVMGK
ncbi:ornithine carbamoyltransferase [Terribacillus saccharophilus]|uniref:Ornithine carbamoyltransferase n=1 Tax=Terribacillus saccharophilus TaxID=361277 RepID=A0A268A866_9BACI|nr:ornithine carbamoyltransferase [Terribacillus saccharophilus]PAD20259.1 ornithine carbamoyltransferase [Terribacillus saccharophilus]PAF20802.1 ornithine carbamoyltransferase [Terribacillus saccharophilus]PAF35806.1 ornithine carbamoyltransferase [Terribacillus saccharophilus]PAF36618.1 ornithine carbamoyltransferase [Terribacillus saccharophilus]